MSYPKPTTWWSFSGYSHPTYGDGGDWKPAPTTTAPPCCSLPCILCATAPPVSPAQPPPTEDVFGLVVAIIFSVLVGAAIIWSFAVNAFEFREQRLWPRWEDEEE